MQKPFAACDRLSWKRQILNSHGIYSATFTTTRGSTTLLSMRTDAAWNSIPRPHAFTGCTPVCCYISEKCKKRSRRIEICDTGSGFDLSAVPAGHCLDNLVSRLNA